jgi:hypothetical protein
VISRYIAAFDAIAALGSANLVLFDREHPRAADALRQWAASTGRVVQTTSTDLEYDQLVRCEIGGPHGCDGHFAIEIYTSARRAA